MKQTKTDGQRKTAEQECQRQAERILKGAVNISWRDGKNARGGKMGRIIVYLDCKVLLLLSLHIQ